MSKIEINIYVTPMSVTELAPVASEGALIPVHTGIVHPDCTIKVWRTRHAKTAGRFDQISHTIQVAVQNSGLPVSALRNEKATKKRGYNKRDQQARERTQSMFGDDNT